MADTELLEAVAASSDARLRRWLVRLLGDASDVPATAVAVLAALADQDADPQVRSQLASTAKRLPGDCGLAIAVAMLAADRSDDRSDPHLPLLLWWAVESHADDPNGMLEDAVASMPELWASQLFTGTVL